MFFDYELVFLALFAASKAFVGQTSEAGTNKRSHDEEPHLTHSAPVIALGEQSDT